RSLVPGGHLWLIVSRTANDADDDSIGASVRIELAVFSDAVWDVKSDVSPAPVFTSPEFVVISIRKRPCPINARSCPWMDKDATIRRDIAASGGDDDLFPMGTEDTYLDYERRAAVEVTITPSVAERTRETIGTSPDGHPTYLTVLTEATVRRAVDILRKHGFVVLRGLLHPSQTLQWGRALLSDFDAAVERLRSHPTRPVDLLNPRGDVVGGEGGAMEERQTRTFEPLSYKEMAMREDLRVDLRSGPATEALRREVDGRVAREWQTKKGGAGLQPPQTKENDNVNADDNGPTLVHASDVGSTVDWRLHPSLLSILKSLFNPRDDALSTGNFGRWNFGERGRTALPNPCACPGAGDQAIHADAPHLFENTDCHPCHYCNVFTPGYQVVDEPGSRNNFDADGVWTGNTDMGGTAFVHGSHRLSVSARLTSEEGGGFDDEAGDQTARRLRQLRTIRPALDVGDVAIFDCRTMHYGLANTSREGEPGARRRPMLYSNVTQAWFHDPKNWDDRERIFD
ncbi:hypothetical protein ACHAWF_003378, partial [Thalassiosira exigua]